METITALDGVLAYPRVIDHVLKNGVIRLPRGQRTLDAGFTVIELDSPIGALPLGCRRGLSQNIAAAEALQLIGGFSQPDLLLNASPNFQRYLNGDGFHGAYGARIRTQILSALTKLKHDQSTRQAVVTLWDPHLDNLPGMNDYPCTVALQFELNEYDRLCMNVMMRSNDVWLGLPYDMFQFTQLQLTVARAAGLEPGWYRHIALSMHIYERDVTAAHLVHDAVSFPIQPVGLGRHGDSYAEIMRRARRLSVTGAVLDQPTMSEEWYGARVTSIMG